MPEFQSRDAGGSDAADSPSGWSLMADESAPITRGCRIEWNERSFTVLGVRVIGPVGSAARHLEAELAEEL